MKASHTHWPLLITLFLLFAASRVSAYYDPSVQRWINRDPLESAEVAEGPNLFQFVGNDPIAYLDTDGRAKIKYFIRALRGGWRECTKDRLRRALENRADGLITGPGQSKEGKNLGKEIWGDKSMRDDGHLLENGEQGMPHYQHRNGGRGHIFYGTGLAAAISAKNVLGETLGEAVDFFNPLCDAAEAYDLWAEGTSECIEQGYCSNPNLEGM